MSGYAREEYLTPADDLPFIGKPFTTRAIVDRLRSLLAESAVATPDEPSGLTRSVVATDWLLASATGVLLALSFPKFGHPACAWVALVPLMLALRGPGPLGTPEADRGRARVRPGLVGRPGLLRRHRLLDQRRAGAVRRPADAAWRRWQCCCWPAISRSIRRRRRRPSRRACPASAIARWRWCRRPGWRPSSCAGAFFGGFPWVPLGNSQVEVLPIAQLASVVGVYGLSAFVAVVNVAVVVAFLSRGTHALGHGGAGGAGHRRDGQLGRAGGSRGRTLIAGRAGAARRPRAGQHRAGRQVGPASGAADHHHLHGDVARRGQARRAVRHLAGVVHAGHVRGRRGHQRDRARAGHASCACRCSSAATSSSAATTPRYYNAAFLLGADGRTQAVYRKIQLVPFGEFFPFQRWLSFVSPLVERAAPFAAGASVVMLPVGTHRTSTAICYEVVYPAPGARGRAGRQRTADDHHQRRVVWRDVGAVSALRHGLDAGHRAGPLPGAGGQHRDQRHRRSVRPGRRSGRASSSRWASWTRYGFSQARTIYAAWATWCRGRALRRRRGCAAGSRPRRRRRG